MGHEVVEMFSVRKAPWHLGMKGGTTEDQTHVLKEYPGREEAMKLAGHFPIAEGPVFSGPGQRIIGFKRLFNADTDKTVFVVQAGYEVIQSSELWDLTEAILDTQDVKWETAGTLAEGRVMWTLARVDKPFFITGDDSPIYPFVAASTTHDGKGSMKVQNLQTRIVCMNTHHAAERETGETGREFTFRHVKGVHNRIEQAKKILAGAEKRASDFQELGEELVKMSLSDEGIEKFVTEFLPAPSKNIISKKVQENIENERDKVRGLFYHSLTVNENIRNTGYGAFQVGVEYLDHLRTYKTNATYLRRTLLRPEPFKAKLVPLIKRIVAEEEKKVVVTV